MRIERHEYLMRAAMLASRRSTCNRLQVGAVLVHSGRIIVSGYNGPPSGFPHCDPEVCRMDKPCTRTVHAEANCIYFAARHGLETLGTSMYCTDSPCENCAYAIINAGITDVIYLREYRDPSPILLLQRAGIRIGGYGCGGYDLIRELERNAS